MILVDTSVWIEHLRAGNERLKTLLFDQQVLCHPFVVGELACGTLQKRGEILADLKALPEAHLVEHEEAMSFPKGTAFIWARHRLGGCASSRFDTANRVLPLDLRQATPESSSSLEPISVNFPMR